MASTSSKKHTSSFDIFTRPDLVEKAARKYIAERIAEERAMGLPITYYEDGKIIREHADGRKETLKNASR